jgi:hypothetical protein
MPTMPWLRRCDEQRARWWIADHRLNPSPPGAGRPQGVRVGSAACEFRPGDTLGIPKGEALVVDIPLTS